MLGTFGILFSLILLIYLAYRDVSVLVLAPVCALVAVALQGDLPLLATYTQIFMASVGQFVKDFFPLFLLGAIFGKLMEDSGAAARIADVIVRAVGMKRTVLAVVLSCAILTYGGVSLFVVVFAVFPLAQSLFRQADLPGRLIPGTIALGSFTFTMTALPGSPQIQNQIPMPFFRTTAFAAPGLGCIGGLVMFLLGMWWLSWRVSAARARQEGFQPIPVKSNDSPTAVEPRMITTAPSTLTTPSTLSTTQRLLPSAWSAFLPILCAVLLNFVFSQWIIPQWDTSYLSEELYGKTELKRVLGVWSTILSMLSAIAVTIALHYRQTSVLKEVLSSGARSSLLPLFNTACEYGYGNTIKTLAGFAVIQKLVTGIVPSNPLISEALAVNVLAGITGSASGGLSIALNALGETYYQQGLAAGIHPDLLHRVASMSCGGLDSLPHNGAAITLLLVCGMTHRQSYKDIAVVTILCPLAGTLTVLTLGSLWGSF
ncbi:MAG: GntP family permease [Pirellulaceae bacterium]|nr:GntP family permease [Pirellulaceae bacterium]